MADPSKEQDNGTQSADVGVSACPICFEAWTSTGNHRLCSLACGHLFGQLCITKWIKQPDRQPSKVRIFKMPFFVAKHFRRSFLQCPQCNRKSKLKDIRTLYMPCLPVADGNKEVIQELRVENQKLKMKHDHFANTLQAEIEGLKRKYNQDLDGLRAENCKLRLQVNKMLGAVHSAGALLTDLQVTQDIDITEELQESSSVSTPKACKPHRLTESSPGTMSHKWIHSCGPFERSQARAKECSPSGFVLQEELPLQGARVFDMDGHSQLLLISERRNNTLFLSKMSLMTMHGGEPIILPPDSQCIRDVQICPPELASSGRPALVSCLNKKLLLLSLQSNNVVASYSLPSSPWSCAWNLKDPTYFYAGLQSGSLLMFDIRHSSLPLNTINGFSTKPVHSLHHVSSSIQNYNGESASLDILGVTHDMVCFWDSCMLDHGRVNCRPHVLLEPADQGACVSFAYDQLTGLGIASFQPKSRTVLDTAFPYLSSQQIQLTTPCDGRLTQSTHVTQTYSHYSLVRKSKEDHIADSPLDLVDSCEYEWNWTELRGLEVCKGQAMLVRSAVIPNYIAQDTKRSLFAFANEKSKSLCLWDLPSLVPKGCLKPHPSPITDIKHVNSRSQNWLCCISDRMLQVYTSII